LFPIEKEPGDGLAPTTAHLLGGGHRLVARPSVTNAFVPGMFPVLAQFTRARIGF